MIKSIYAQEPITNPALGPNLQGKEGTTFFSELIPRFIGLGFLIGALVFFFIMIVGAIQWIASGGDKAAIESARGKLINAVIGIIILFSLFALVKILEGLFSIDILTLDIGGLQVQ